MSEKKQQTMQRAIPVCIYLSIFPSYSSIFKIELIIFSLFEVVEFCFD